MTPFHHERLSKLLMDYVNIPRSKLNDEKLRECLQSVSSDNAYQVLRTVVNHLEHTAVYLAARRNQPETLKRLLNSVTAESRYQLLTVQNVDGATPLHDATYCGWTDVVVCIYNSITAKQRYQLLTIQAMFGHTTLHYAAWQGRTELSALLLDSVVPAQQMQLLSIGNINGDTAIDVARKWGNLLTADEIAKYKVQGTATDYGKHLSYFTLNILKNRYSLLKI